MTSRKVSAIGYLQGILLMLDNRAKRPSAELLEQIRGLANDAISVMKEPDPDKRKIGFILLAIQESTAVKVITLGGKRMTRVTILDQTIYHWALEEIHKLVGVRA